jgi:hypothetical protein
MRTMLVIAGPLVWVLWGLLWVWPLKRDMLKKHGPDTTNEYLIRLAKSGNPDARRLRERSWIFLGVGLVGGLLIAVTKSA